MDKGLREYLSKEKFGAEAARYLVQHYDLFNRNETYRRREIVAQLKEAFKQIGGDPNTTKDLIASSIKKLLQSGDIQFRSVGRGIYRFEGKSDDDAIEELPYDIEQEIDSEFNPERSYGEGSHEVYAWCLPLYRIHNNQNCWPIKIGRAGTDGLKRRFLDFEANLPERPNYLIRLGCTTETEARDRERLLHHYFRERKKNIKSLPGTEWFNTNPDEIHKAISDLFPSA